ncbi:MAG: hypothetical protein KBF76_01470 [Verrucomicrobiales bacterium]|jgi:hypothetical protein|nr:hypothetical protein [Verrucomicrobiales bacterium]HQZ27126.1 hypothetical protein [Verrucomicrobiales bacterium]
MNLRILILLTVVLIVTSGSTARSADSKINQSAQDLAKFLAPAAPARKVDKADLEKLRTRMIALVEQLERSTQSNGPGPESLITKAYEFRDEVAGVERLLTRSAVLNAWREANSRGLFDEAGKYTGKITKGRGTGQDCVFELIIPAESYLPASNQIANLRIVPVEQKRSTEDPLTHRDASFQRELASMIEEKSRSAALAKFENPESTNALGMTAKEEAAAWDLAVKEAGEAAAQRPKIRLSSGINGSPSHMTKQRWKNETEVTNISQHPTEVTVEIYLIGSTEKKKDYYLMAKSTETVRLRMNERKKLTLYTKAESSYKKLADDRDELTKEERKQSSVHYRGFVVLAKHKNEVVSHIGSDQRLEEFGNPKAEKSPLTALPAF